MKFALATLCTLLGVCAAGSMDRTITETDSRKYSASCDTVRLVLKRLAVAGMTDANVLGAVVTFVNYDYGANRGVWYNFNDGQVLAEPTGTGSSCTVKVTRTCSVFYLSPATSCDYLWSKRNTAVLDAVSACKTKVPLSVVGMGTFKNKCYYAKNAAKVNDYLCYDQLAPTNDLPTCNNLAITANSDGTINADCDGKWGTSNVQCVNGLLLNKSTNQVSALQVVTKTYTNSVFMCNLGNEIPRSCADGVPSFKNPSGTFAQAASATGWLEFDVTCKFPSECPAAPVFGTTQCSWWNVFCS